MCKREDCTLTPKEHDRRARLFRLWWDGEITCEEFEERMKKWDETPRRMARDSPSTTPRP